MRKTRERKSEDGVTIRAETGRTEGIVEEGILDGRKVPIRDIVLRRVLLLPDVQRREVQKLNDPLISYLLTFSARRTVSNKISIPEMEIHRLFHL